MPRRGKLRRQSKPRPPPPTEGRLSGPSGAHAHREPCARPPPRHLAWRARLSAPAPVPPRRGVPRGSLEPRPNPRQRISSCSTRRCLSADLYLVGEVPQGVGGRVAAGLLVEQPVQPHHPGCRRSARTSTPSKTPRGVACWCQRHFVKHKEEEKRKKKRGKVEQEEEEEKRVLLRSVAHTGDCWGVRLRGTSGAARGQTHNGSMGDNRSMEGRASQGEGSTHRKRTGPEAGPALPVAAWASPPPAFPRAPSPPPRCRSRRSRRARRSKAPRTPSTVAVCGERRGGGRGQRQRGGRHHHRDEAMAAAARRWAE